jgi:hypothetical protein
MEGERGGAAQGCQTKEQGASKRDIKRARAVRTLRAGSCAGGPAKVRGIPTPRIRCNTTCGLARRKNGGLEQENPQ